MVEAIREKGRCSAPVWASGHPEGKCSAHHRRFTFPFPVTLFGARNFNPLENRSQGRPSSQQNNWEIERTVASGATRPPSLHCSRSGPKLAVLPRLAAQDRGGGQGGGNQDKNTERSDGRTSPPESPPRSSEMIVAVAPTNPFSSLPEIRIHAATIL